MLLPPEGASFCKPCFSSRGLAEDSRTADTQNYRLCVAEDGGDFVASRALNVHEVGVGALHQALLLVLPLLLFRGRVQEILRKGHVLVGRSSPPERSESGNPAAYIRRPPEVTRARVRPPCRSPRAACGRNQRLWTGCCAATVGARP